MYTLLEGEGGVCVVRVSSQEEYRDQCGDGTPEGGDTMLFPCQPGHALFTPITDLLPDSRFLSPEADNREY